MIAAANLSTASATDPSAHPDASARPDFKSRTWAPLLAGADADAAWRAIEAIAHDLESWPLDEQLPPTLAGGSGGMAIFFSYLALTTDNERWADAACACLQHMIDGALRLSPRPSFYSGFTGAAWTLDHLHGRLLEDTHDEPGEVIDAQLESLLSCSQWPGDYDLINGLVGFGVYALEGLPRAGARRCLVRIVGHLENLADKRPEGLVWRTGPHLLVGFQRDLFPNGCDNLGLAHGVPGVISLLAAIAASGVESERAGRLLEAAMSWLLAQEHALGGTCFPHSLADGIEPAASRTAWCYGDPGVGIGLLHAGRLTGNGAWRRIALRVLHGAARRPGTDSGISDAGLCHGAAGLGHLFQRAAQGADDDPMCSALEESARRWFRSALMYRVPEAGIGGYRAWTMVEDVPPSWQPIPGFLEGAAGIGLALLAAVTSMEPAWDRVLMTSLRIQSQAMTNPGEPRDA